MKPTFTKLGLKALTEVKAFTWNGQEIEVRQYLPINERLALIGRVIQSAADENNFVNPVKLYVLLRLELIYTMTNISFTEKQKEDPAKLYDMIAGNAEFNTLLKENMPLGLETTLYGEVMNCADAIYKYRNSALGILETISQDYATADLNADKIQEKLQGVDVGFLKDVMEKLG